MCQPFNCDSVPHPVLETDEKKDFSIYLFQRSFK